MVEEAATLAAAAAAAADTIPETETETTIGDRMNDLVITMDTMVRVPIAEDKTIGHPMTMTEIGLAHVILGMIETLRTGDQDRAPRTVLPPRVRPAMGPVVEVEAEDFQEVEVEDVVVAVVDVVAVVVSKTVSHALYFNSE